MQSQKISFKDLIEKKDPDYWGNIIDEIVKLIAEGKKNVDSTSSEK